MGQRLLIIDDDLMVCEVVKDRLEAMGYAVLVANDGRTGLALMALDSKHAPIGGVLLDMHMPVMDGLHVLRELRAYHGHVPVVMMTGDPDRKTREEALRLGASHYVEKPIDMRRFAQLCEQTFPQDD